MKFPNDENGSLLAEMLAAGIDLSQNHDIDFYHLFEKQPQAEKMTALIGDKYPDTTVRLFEDETPGVWDVCCTVNIEPSYDNVCEAEKTFESVADKCNGYADGWGLLGDEPSAD
jgi:hypothetical protein